MDSRVKQSLLLSRYTSEVYKELLQLQTTEHSIGHRARDCNWNCLNQFRVIIRNQTSDVLIGSTLIMSGDVDV